MGGKMTQTPNDEEEHFSEEERITANLRIRSVSPTQRTLLAFFAFIPPKWRGPVAILTVLIIGLLLLKAPSFVDWVKGMFK